MKTTLRILLGIAIIFLAYICVMSVVTPIHFENEKTKRDEVVIKKLVGIREAEKEFMKQNGRYIADLDSLILFLQTGKMKELHKEGSLTDAQLEAGLTEAKAVKIIKKGNLKEIQQNGLEGFIRDTIYTDLIPALFKDEYTAENIADLIIIPFSNGQRFEIESDGENPVRNIEVRAHYNTYLHDLDKQELVNLIDKEEKLEHYPGLRFGDVNNRKGDAGNWE